MSRVNIVGLPQIIQLRYMKWTGQLSCIENEKCSFKLLRSWVCKKSVVSTSDFLIICTSVECPLILDQLVSWVSGSILA